MSINPPLTNLPIEKADSGFYQGFNQAVTIGSKALIRDAMREKSNTD